MENNAKVLNEIITIIINGIYQNTPFNVINNCIVNLNNLKTNILENKMTEKDNEIIDEALKVIMNGTFQNYSFLTINNAVIQLNNLKIEKKQIEGV